MTETLRPNCWRRFADWDKCLSRLEKFAREDPANGFFACRSPRDPKPGVGIRAGRIAAMDGVLAHDFDMIDAVIAADPRDHNVAVQAMAILSETLARMPVDTNVPRDELVRLAQRLTPAKQADVVRSLNALETAVAYAEMRARKTPGNQAHVTNAKDDPLQLATDAAIAVASGLDENETTMRVARNAWSNAVACAVGASVGRWGVLFQCASQEAEELRIGMASLPLQPNPYRCMVHRKALPMAMILGGPRGFWPQPLRHAASRSAAPLARGPNC